MQRDVAEKKEVKKSKNDHTTTEMARREKRHLPLILNLDYGFKQKTKSFRKVRLPFTERQDESVVR